MTTERQINLVKASWAVVAHTDGDAAALLYFRLGELDRGLGQAVQQEFASEGARVVRMLDAAIYGLDTENPAREIARAFEPTSPVYTDFAYYDTFAAALFWTLARRMGSAFTDEMFKAWSGLYMRLFVGMHVSASQLDLAAAA